MSDLKKEIRAKEDVTMTLRVAILIRQHPAVAATGRKLEQEITTEVIKEAVAERLENLEGEYADRLGLSVHRRYQEGIDFDVSVTRVYE